MFIENAPATHKGVRNVIDRWPAVSVHSGPRTAQRLAELGVAALPGQRFVINDLT